MSPLSWDDVKPGVAIPPVVRTTTVANWNRYAAVNDEFIDIHMDDDAAKAVGMPGVFGMGNLRIAYLHNAMAAWLGDAGDLAEFRCEFRGLNMKGDTLTAHGTVTGRTDDDGLRRASLEIGVTNQDGAETCPGAATVLFFDNSPRMPEEPAPAEPSGAATPGAFLTNETIDKIGRVLPAVASPPVGANDITRWAVATHWPDPPPAQFTLGGDTPWGGLVAPRDFDPFAWMPNRPWSGDWLWGMGAEPGKRVLNGGQRNLYFEPIRPGDVISVIRRFVDVVERDTKRGPMVFFTSEFRWTNQRDEPVRLAYQTTIYY